MKRPNPILAAIAREHLSIPTLETRRADSLDFHDVAVWQVEAALKAAFDAGKDAESQDSTQEAPVHAAVPTPLLVAKGTLLVSGKMYLRLYHGHIRSNLRPQVHGLGQITAARCGQAPARVSGSNESKASEVFDQFNEVRAVAYAHAPAEAICGIDAKAHKGKRNPFGQTFGPGKGTKERAQVQFRKFLPSERTLTIP